VVKYTEDIIPTLPIHLSV